MLILVLFLGILVGIITGLIPGIHVNLIAVLLVSSLSVLSKYFSPIELGIFLISMVIVHSFLDFIPSIFLGAPEAATALSILPGHKLLLDGKGYTALKLTVIGGFGATLFSIILLPILFLYLEKIYEFLSQLIAPLLIFFSSLFILKEKKKIWSLIIFLFSGILGLIVLNGINIKQPLFPLLSGLFGLPVLIISLFKESSITKQKINKENILFSKNRIFSYLKASFSSVLVSILPAIGSAQAAIISTGFSKLKNEEDFLVTLGGINTAGGLFTLTVFYIIGKARTGVISSLQQFITLDFQNYFILLLSGLIAVGFGIILSLKIGKIFAEKISKINYKKVSLFIIFLIFILVLILTGFLGLLVLSVSAAIGLLAPQLGVRRIHLMGCLVLPIILYFI